MEDDTPAPPGPGSLAWEYAGDWRLLFGVGRALLLQVAHPAVGAGVSQHSDFRADPWGRFDRTLGSLMIQVYGGDAALDEARRLREMHRSITGVDHRGQPYRALDPEAYWWVHATIFDTILSDHAHFGRPLSPPLQEQLYGEWRALGRVLGIPASRMPPTVAAFRVWFDGVVDRHLGDNPAVRDLLDALTGAGTPAPPWWPLPARSWPTAGRVLGATLTRITVGTLPVVLRARLGLPWTPADQRRMDVVAAVARRSVPAVPLRWRYHPVAVRAIRAGSALPTGCD